MIVIHLSGNLYEDLNGNHYSLKQGKLIRQSDGLPFKAKRLDNETFQLCRNPW